MIDGMIRNAGRYGLPLQLMKIVQEPQTEAPQTSEPLIRAVEKVNRSVPPRASAVPREEWVLYAELRVQMKRLRCPDQRRSYSHRTEGGVTSARHVDEKV
ncbi:hypothetical protein CIG75_04165 [Tumebacillus algifaecis]|uniref:Uncharacterized protein n=1 Tax=Tumebacillus algifaecis TaxID=1214604 RepID=A0A223CYV2_9BACL|nr:hypothetical protein [Tumebacillus algifaecis]ASS74257.1 hypothetical protein CIG75_04165 [Tumebacillus algifaecis]